MGPPIASPAAAPANFPQIDIADPPNKYRLEHKDFYGVPHADNRLAGGRFWLAQDLDGTGPESRKLARIESFGSSISSPAASRLSTWRERANVQANSQRVISPVMTLPTSTKVWPRSNRSAPATMKAMMMMPKAPTTTIAALIEVTKRGIGWSPPWRGRGVASVCMGDLIAETPWKAQEATWFETRPLAAPHHEGPHPEERSKSASRRMGRESLGLGDVAADLARGADDLDAPRADELVEVHGDVIRRGERHQEAVRDAADDDRAPIGRAAVIGFVAQRDVHVHVGLRAGDGELIDAAAGIPFDIDAVEIDGIALPGEAPDRHNEGRRIRLAERSGCGKSGHRNQRQPGKQAYHGVASHPPKSKDDSLTGDCDRL